MIPRLATEAVATGSDHAGAEFVEDLERRLVAVQAKLALELDGRDAWRMAQRRAWRLLVSAAKLPIVCLGVNRISMVSLSCTNMICDEWMISLATSLIFRLFVPAFSKL